MADKVYIVANEDQEHEVIKKLSDKGIMWPVQDGRGIYWSPVHKYIEYPYALNDDGEQLNWVGINHITNEEIVYDGRKENKVKISKEAYDALVEWKKRRHPINNAVNSFDLMELSRKDEEWWQGIDTTKTTNTNNWLITLIRWASGEDVFEIEKSKKWVVRSKETDETGHYWHISLTTDKKFSDNGYGLKGATKFDTYEEAESWANAHQEVVEVEA